MSVKLKLLFGVWWKTHWGTIVTWKLAFDYFRRSSFEETFIIIPRTQPLSSLPRGMVRITVALECTRVKTHGVDLSLSAIYNRKWRRGEASAGYTLENSSTEWLGGIWDVGLRTVQATSQVEVIGNGFFLRSKSLWEIAGIGFWFDTCNIELGWSDSMCACPGGRINLCLRSITLPLTAYWLQSSNEDGINCSIGYSSTSFVSSPK